ncbi:hypothetical protein V6x_48680 [Gimesia chilikensis]|uniref:Uncharacterized protein n=1 Tax=Gimesia chilikensis TaxID=2605989 RepID=A0A517WIR2_9PLAN|nr:hypothetical protein HG66A1_49810 [Gimesia chilikensis]QDT87065.1 hypothetical protein MalM14_47490 [Gimesia chilikensis]QDU05133.1 hypothetical protein V6x_48680 [Gimesia chilikensis]
MKYELLMKTKVMKYRLKNFFENRTNFFANIVINILT